MSTSEVLEAFLSLRRNVALLRAAQVNDLEFGHNQIGILYRLSLSNATMGELAEYSVIDKASVTRTVASLEKAGFAKRVGDMQDRRIVHIELTPKGKAKARLAKQIRDSIGKKLDNTLSESERKQLLFFIHKITENLKPKKD